MKDLKYTVALIGLFIWTGAAIAQTPGFTWGQYNWEGTFDQCMERSPNALAAEGFTTERASERAWAGSKLPVRARREAVNPPVTEPLAVLIICYNLSGGATAIQSQVTIVVTHGTSDFSKSYPVFENLKDRIFLNAGNPDNNGGNPDNSGGNQVNNSILGTWTRSDGAVVEFKEIMEKDNSGNDIWLTVGNIVTLASEMTSNQYYVGQRLFWFKRTGVNPPNYSGTRNVRSVDRQTRRDVGATATVIGNNLTVDFDFFETPYQYTYQRGSAPTRAQPAVRNTPLSTVPGRLLEQISVDTKQSVPVMSRTVLEAGRNYVIEGSGSFSVWGTRTSGVDPVFCHDPSACGGPPRRWDQLRIDGKGFSDYLPEIPYQEDHIYRIPMRGTGRSVSIVIIDAEQGSGWDNAGQLEVKIYEAAN